MSLDSLLTGENAALVDDLYNSWLAEPSSVSADWAELFSEWADEPNGVSYQPPAFTPSSIFNARGQGLRAVTASVASEVAQRQARVVQLINAYRVRGHLVAKIDPLSRVERHMHPELTLEYHGLEPADLQERVLSAPLYGEPEVSPLANILKRLERTYCGHFGVEYMNIDDQAQKLWLAQRMETLFDKPVLTHDEELRVLEKLSDAENFERLIHTRFPGTKRFSLEGGETLIPLLDSLVEDCAEQGVREIIIGMAHRGRLNTLVNLMGKPAAQVIEEFHGIETDFDGSGDVKYHLGYSNDHRTRRGFEVHLNLCFNPSHLEAVSPVAEGRVRAKQDRWRLDEGQERDARMLCMPLLIHGDAAFAGQGLVAETLNLSELQGYETGGTIHVIVNNQIGFTTSPKDARSTPYCSGIARMLGVPIFHVNGEDPEAVLAVTRLAVEWRQRYHRDVIIDLYCFRKYGHNEGDEPSFTQPLLYEAIRSHASARETYARRLVEKGSLTQEDVDRVAYESRERLSSSDAGARYDSYTGNVSSAMGRLWRKYRSGDEGPVDTRVPKDRLVDLITRCNTLPDTLTAHVKVKRLMNQRMAICSGQSPVDWAVAEQAAYATLCAQGIGVRLSGQDVARGTFSHRHAVLTDSRDGTPYVPLNELGAPFHVYNSCLSEAGVLGFEYGYSLDYPDALVIWEAQFGDFANGAQVIIDQFLVATEQKWNRMSGLVLLLPHGYEGQGPEHSSARIERYAQLCAEENIRLANCTTPANFYHLLRRQAVGKTRKPLVVFTPKSLLRHPSCVSSLEELAEGAFLPVIGDTLDDLEAVERVVLCQGKVYYDLLAERNRRDEGRVALVRVEEIYPVPGAELVAELSRYPASAELVWCQEEPRNQGAWPMYDEWLLECIGHERPIRYVGRRPAASPAPGSNKVHKQNQARLVSEALTLEETS